MNGLPGHDEVLEDKRYDVQQEMTVTNAKNWYGLQEKSAMDD